MAVATPNTIKAPVNPAAAARKRGIGMVFSSISGRQRSSTARPTNESWLGKFPDPLEGGVYVKGAGFLREFSYRAPGLARLAAIGAGKARFDQHLTEILTRAGHHAGTDPAAILVVLDVVQGNLGIGQQLLGHGSGLFGHVLFALAVAAFFRRVDPFDPDMRDALLPQPDHH